MTYTNFLRRKIMAKTNNAALVRTALKNAGRGGTRSWKSRAQNTSGGEKERAHRNRAHRTLAGVRCISWQRR